MASLRWQVSYPITQNALQQVSLLDLQFDSIRTKWSSKIKTTITFTNCQGIKGMSQHPAALTLAFPADIKIKCKCIFNMLCFFMLWLAVIITSYAFSGVINLNITLTGKSYTFMCQILYWRTLWVWSKDWVTVEIWWRINPMHVNKCVRFRGPSFSITVNHMKAPQTTGSMYIQTHCTLCTLPVGRQTCFLPSVWLWREAKSWTGSRGVWGGDIRGKNPSTESADLTMLTHRDCMSKN